MLTPPSWIVPLNQDLDRIYGSTMRRLDVVTDCADGTRVVFPRL